MDSYGELQAVLDSLQRSVDAAREPSPSRAPQREATSVRAFAVQFTRSIRSIELRIAGSHYSGLSNQRLLEIRRNEGRDFDAWTAQLRQALSQHLQSLWRSRGSIPTLDEAVQDAEAFLHDAIVERIESGGNDVMLQRLTPAYAALKRKAGKGGKPIGVLTGAWLASVRRRGQVRVVR